jgi:hypothetical protein
MVEMVGMGDGGDGGMVVMLMAPIGVVVLR